MFRRTVVLFVLATACLPPWPADALQLQLVTNNLFRPVAITHAGDGSGRLFITEQNGRIRVWDGTQLLPTPFLSISPLVSCCGERGLLSVAFHPGYETNGLFYVNYTRSGDGATVIARYSVSTTNANIANTNATILLTIPQPFSNHNGGQLQFGPDGYLYIGMGDGGDAEDPQNNGQRLDTLLGKMLRIDVDGAAPYAIPPDNPFVGVAGALPEIWSYGLRNPWRFSFDRLTGDLFIGDVGQYAYEEINFQPAGSPGGENYGWRLMEGFHCFNPTNNCNDGSLTLPILEYSHSLGNAVTGGYRYRGAQMPQFSGTYFYGDYGAGRIWGATNNGATWTTTELTNTAFLVSTFGEDEQGELYITHYATNGALYRIAAPFYPPGDVNGDQRVTGADSLLINQVQVGLRSNTHPIFATTGFANGDVNTNGAVSGADSLLINQVLVGLRPYIVTKTLPGVRTHTEPVALSVFGVGFPTNEVPVVTIGLPVDLTLSNAVVISREQLTAIVPAGGGLGTGTVNVSFASTNGVISFGRFVNQ